MRLKHLQTTKKGSGLVLNLVLLLEAEAVSPSSILAIFLKKIQLIGVGVLESGILSPAIQGTQFRTDMWR
jgi:hypothetical protein